MENFVVRGLKLNDEESKSGREKRKETLKIFDQHLVERNDKKRKIKLEFDGKFRGKRTKIRWRGIKVRKREEERNVEDIRLRFDGKEW